MAVLIVDDESDTREVLRQLLVEQGFKTILEARDGVEALSILKDEHVRIKMIVSDWEMPNMNGLTLLGKVAENPELDLCPFLLITSDVPEARIKEFRQSYPRLDNYLAKPFRKNHLNAAMIAAYDQRLQSRDLALFAGVEVSTDLKQAVAFKGSIWKNFKIAGSMRELEKAVTSEPRRLSALFISSEACSWISYDWLSSFKKTRLGQETPVLCLSRDPKKIQPIRIHGQFFFAESSSGSELQEKLKSVCEHLRSRLQNDLLIAEAKLFLQPKDYKSARKLLLTVVKGDPVNAEALSLLGSADSELEDYAKAVTEFRAALLINPCIPQNYLKILRLKTGLSPSEQCQIAEEAVSFCPQNQDVLSIARKILGHTEKSKS